MCIQVAIVDEQDLIRYGVEHSLADLPKVCFMGGFATLEGFFQSPKAHKVNVLLVSDTLPGLTIKETLERVVEHCPRTRVILLGTQFTPRGMRAVLAAGASGVICRHESVQKFLLSGIQLVHEGEVYLSPRAVLIFAENDKPLYIPPRPRQVLDLIAQKKEIPEIALILQISRNAAYLARTRLRKILEVESNEQILPEARRRGLLDDTDE